jgi:hypothetical protein
VRVTAVTIFGGQDDNASSQPHCSSSRPPAAEQRVAQQQPRQRLAHQAVERRVRHKVIHLRQQQRAAAGRVVLALLLGPLQALLPLCGACPGVLCLRAGRLCCASATEP